MITTNHITFLYPTLPSKQSLLVSTRHSSPCQMYNCSKKCQTYRRLIHCFLLWHPNKLSVKRTIYLLKNMKCINTRSYHYSLVTVLKAAFVQDYFASSVREQSSTQSLEDCVIKYQFCIWHNNNTPFNATFINIIDVYFTISHV